MHMYRRVVTAVVAAVMALAAAPAFAQGQTQVNTGFGIGALAGISWTTVRTENDTDFNFDYHVSFTEAEIGTKKVDYNYRLAPWGITEGPGISVFATDASGAVFRTYSTYGRGIDMMNNAYNYLDLVPRGRDEAELPHTMSWVKLRDLYDR